jgi:hypothetical protein
MLPPGGCGVLRCPPGTHLDPADASSSRGYTSPVTGARTRSRTRDARELARRDAAVQFRRTASRPDFVPSEARRAAGTEVDYYAERSDL